jgi:predicted RNase H-like nuclease (RuvC/YqgF family)
MNELQEGMIVHKAEMLEMDYLRNLGIEPNFADVSRHIEKLLTPALELADNESEISELEADNEELSYNCEALEGKLNSIEDYAARMRKQLKEMDFEGKGEIEAILEDIEGELEL